MRSPALALGWELWARNRVGLALLGTGLAVVVILGQILPTDSTARTMGQLTCLAAMFAFIYLLSVFVYSPNSFGSKSAGFPPRLFALPVRTSVLVLWPMVYGVTTAALGWVVINGLILMPCGLAQEFVWWPALLLAALMASFQAVSWTLVRSVLLRLAVAIVVLPSVLMMVLLFVAKRNIHLSVEEVSACLAAVIVASYLVAVAGVARERRGDRLGWMWLGRLLLRVLPHLPTRRHVFASAQAAQRWPEVRRHAWLLPVLSGMFMAMLFWATTVPLDAREVAQVVAAVIISPVLLAFFVGLGMGKSSFWASDYRLPAFLATRPLSSSAIARPKLEAAALGVAATWLLVAVLAPLWAVLSGNADPVRRLLEMLARNYDSWTLAVALPLAVAGWIGLTWLQMVGGICLSLTGRPGVVNGFALLSLAVLGLLGGLGIYTAMNPDVLDTTLVLAWCVAVALALAKVAVAFWTWSRPGWRDRIMPRLLIVWLLVAGCLLVALYALILPNPLPTHLLALLLVVALPLTRLTAMPAAVAWNRHR
jgi:hypothetical protein